ncbi:MAG: hypothetical protein CR954_00300 [Candidatus Moraniibacteriota bacterium]|nr:MAG: hypothetical protein CR954_00300 [Candidatus Moranbacteria bacterium]
MHITYHGLSCIKIIAKTAGRGSDDVTMLFAPYDPKCGLRPPQGNADIVLIPHTDPQFNNPSVVRGNPIIIDRPGEYAVQGINIVGRDVSADIYGGEKRGNTIVFVLDIEDMKVVYLAGIGVEPHADIIDLIGNPDIVFLPVGDSDGIDGKTAETLARKIEAKIIIPIQYKTKKCTVKTLKDTGDFCSQIGNCPKKSEEKFIVKKADIENTVMEVVSLQVI